MIYIVSADFFLKFKSIKIWLKPFTRLFLKPPAKAGGNSNSIPPTFISMNLRLFQPLPL